MRVRLPVMLFVAGLLVVVAAFGVASPASAVRDRTFIATLTGAAEVPGPGDTDGFGMATVTLTPGTTELCYTITVQDIAPAAAAHIHVGSADEAGQIVVHLTAPTNGTSSGCETLERALFTQILAQPQDYYVNVHNADFRAGAVRGQLGR